MAEYFFTIAHAGLDKNGNSRYRVTGSRKIEDSREFIPLSEGTMTRYIGGRWSDKTESVTTQQNVKQIKERLDKYFTNDYNYTLVSGV